MSGLEGRPDGANFDQITLIFNLVVQRECDLRARSEE
jgi:hypothetical protein